MFNHGASVSLKAESSAAWLDNIKTVGRIALPPFYGVFS